MVKTDPLKCCLLLGMPGRIHCFQGTIMRLLLDLSHLVQWVEMEMVFYWEPWDILIPNAPLQTLDKQHIYPASQQLHTHGWLYFFALLYVSAKEHNGACLVLISGKHMRFCLKGSLSIFEYSYRTACILSFGGFKGTNVQFVQDRQTRLSTAVWLSRLFFLTLPQTWISLSSRVCLTYPGFISSVIFYK